SRKTNDWKTPLRGGYKAVGIGGSLTGHGADFPIIDDPIKDFEEARSEVIRETVWNWYLSTAVTRLSPGGVIIIIMTRWHEEDLVGRLIDPERSKQMQDAGIKTEDWEVINIPAIAKDSDPIMERANPGKPYKDPLGRKAGEVLSRF